MSQIATRRGSSGSSGRFTPNVSGTSNVSSIANVASGLWSRVGNIVIFSGSFDLTATAANTTTIIDVQPPVLSTFTASDDANGAGGGFGTSSQGWGSFANVSANTGNGYITLIVTSVSTSAQTINFIVQYEVK